MAWRLSGFGRTAALLALLGTHTAAAADTISLRVEVYGLVGLHVLSLHSQVDEVGDRYAVSVDYATKGIAGVLDRYTSKSTVRGRLTGAAAAPESFHSDGTRNGVERHNWVEYRRDGSVDGGSNPPLPQPLPPTTGRGTVDNLTAYFLLERQLARTGSCALAVPVFDGRHRYDLYFTNAGEQTLSPSGGQQFSGKATVCQMQRHFLPGVPENEQNEGANAGKIWYAKLINGGDVMVPVRMQLQTQIGSVNAYLAELHGRGTDLKLME